MTMKRLASLALFLSLLLPVYSLAAPVAGTVVGGAVVPSDSADTYPVTNPHYGLGGTRTLATTAHRNAIPSARLQEGMLVYVQADGKTYQLKAGYSVPTVDANWAVFASSSVISTTLEYYVAQTTSDENPVNIFSYTLPDYTMISYDVTVHGVCVADGSTLKVKLLNGANRGTDPAVLDGPDTITGPHRIDSTLDVMSDVGGSNVVIKVTGLAAKTVQWFVWVKIYKTTLP
jgi:hypothetical protein